MQMDLRAFEKEIPGKVLRALDEMRKGGYVPTVVGGIVRDYLLDGRLGTDWDIEVSHPRLAWDLQNWKDFGKSLSKLGRVNFLPFEVIRLTIEGNELELSPPRLESFTEDHHHKNFTPTYDLSLPFEEGIKRRDFTINAMGIRLGSELEFLDPLEGLRHLREKVLHPCGEDFKKDPVRFLRAYRFRRRLGFEFSPTLQSILVGMRALGFSHTYLWQEMQKSKHPLLFLADLLQVKESHPELDLPLPPSTLPQLKSLNEVLDPSGGQESWVIALEWTGISSEGWVEYFCLGHESARRLGRWAQNSKNFRNRHPEDFQEDFETVVLREDFLQLFDWYFSTKQIQQKYPALDLLRMIEEYLPEWIHLFRFEVVKDVKHIDPPLRAKYQVWNLCQRL